MKKLKGEGEIWQIPEGAYRIEIECDNKYNLTSLDCHGYFELYQTKDEARAALKRMAEKFEIELTEIREGA